jgi:MFS transporter, BCD family, chlorophyll transporter
MPKLTLPTMFRLGLFQMGLGMMSLLTLGLLNRVMINELGVPAAIAALVIAIPLFMAPARIWFGQNSDSKPLWGYHRTSYVWFGAILFAIAGFLALQVMWQFGQSLSDSGWSVNTNAWLLLLISCFGFYGLSLSASSTPFAALLVDISDQDQRPKLVGIVWSLLMVGIVVGAIAISRVLPCAENFDSNLTIYSDPQKLANLQAGVNRAFVIIPLVVVGLAITATWGIEKRFSRYRDRLADFQNGETDGISFKQALKILTASRQTGLFFIFLLIMTTSLFMQDAVMEPYGGKIFGMGICATTQLNAFFGMGTLIGISGGGFWVVPRLGKQATTKFGCLVASGCCILLVLAGLSANVNLLKASLFAFGLGSGLLTTGATSLMLDLTAAATAGTFIGAWGLAQAIARGSATVLGGVILDIGKSIFGNGLAAFAAVFLLEAVGLIVAVVVLAKLNVEEFQANSNQAIAEVFSGNLE